MEGSKDMRFCTLHGEEVNCLWRILWWHIKNGRDLTEAEDIKKRWQEYKEELYQKDPDVLDNPDNVVADLEPDILESEVKWALESLANNKDSGGDDIPVELFKILKDDAVKVLHSICSKFGKLNSGQRTGKDQSTSQSQRRAVPKNAPITR